VLVSGGKIAGLVSSDHLATATEEIDAS